MAAVYPAGPDPTMTTLRRSEPTFHLAAGPYYSRRAASAPEPRSPSAFFFETHANDFDAALDRFGHVVNRERRGGGADQGFHLDARAIDSAHLDRDAHAGKALVGPQIDLAADHPHGM